MFLQQHTDNSRFLHYQSFRNAMDASRSISKVKWMAGIAGCVLVTLFLPWTQNIRSSGKVSTLSPEHRPQQVNTMIPGRIAKWYVRNGAMVTTGDTLLEITEIKDDYLDPRLSERMAEQLNAKNDANGFYKDKVGSANQQLAALRQSLDLKISQLENKLKQYTLQVQSDSIAMTAAVNQYSIAETQLKRQRELYQAGLKSLTEYEQRQQYYQEALSKKIGTENKFYNSKNELLNIRLERSAASQEYAEKISKVSGERFAALSQAATGTGEIAKLRNQLYNYTARRNFHYIIAPQSGQVLQSTKAGIGETVKDGEQLLTIVPLHFKKAVEIFIDPNDMPLISAGQLVSLQFDGFPAIVFSGWPKASYGLFNGVVVAIDNNIDASGKFKVWVEPDENTKKWPPNIRFGTGCQVVALLNDVPVWYELWRQLNGFPPDFYTSAAKKDQTGKTK